MNVLFIADITGPEAVDYVASRLPQLRRDLAVDLVIANADNVAVTGPHPATGFGMTSHLVELLLEGGVDVVSAGSHWCDGPEATRVLAHDRVLRAENLPPERIGRGRLTLQVDGEDVTVCTIGGPPLFADALPVFPHWSATRPSGTTVIHFVGDGWQARLLAASIDGQAAAVLGTFAHEATCHLYLLPNGTALVPDVGMTGRLGVAGAGHDLKHFTAEFMGLETSSLPPFELAETPMQLEAVWLAIEHGKTTEIKRIT